ncbi:MAG: Ig-like domain-containing protein, partial [Erysipelotrichaceae bacterium]|nr:Ig-like domain-containing protein [Erysipelotrichaceae bacterium]
DYAGNESVVVAQFADQVSGYNEDTIFVPAKTFEEGKSYLITEKNVVGATNLLLDLGDQYYASNAEAEILNAEEGTFLEGYTGLYIPSSYVSQGAVWTPEFTWTDYSDVDPDTGKPAVYAFSDLIGVPGWVYLYNELDGDYNYLLAYPAEEEDDPNELVTFSEATLGSMFGTGYLPLSSLLLWQYYDQLSALYSMGTGAFVSWTATDRYHNLAAEPAGIYLWEPMEISYTFPVNPYLVSSVTVDPQAYTLIPSTGLTTVQLTADVQPITADDRSVTWYTLEDLYGEENTVVTVDQTGLVTAVGLGTTAVYAFANDESGKYGYAVISVVEASPMDAKVNGQIAKEDGTVEFVEIDLSNMSVSTLHTAKEIEGYPYYGGGRAGNYIWGNDRDDDVSFYDVSDGYTYNYLFTMQHKYAMRDGANLPSAPFIDEDGNELTLQLAAITNSNTLLMMTEDGDGTLLDFSEDTDGAVFVALSYFGGGSYSVSGMTIYYFTYVALDTDGIVWMLRPYIIEGAEGIAEADVGAIGYLDGFVVGDDLTAYSMTSAMEQTGSASTFFIADNTTHSIWYFDMNKMNSSYAIPAVYVGSVDGITNLSTLYNENNDAITSVNAGEAPEEIMGMNGPIGKGNIQAVPFHAETAQVKADEIEDPATEPVEVPSEPAADETEAPAEEVTEAPAEEATEAAEEPAEEVTEAPAEEVTEAAEEPAEEVTEAPAEEVTEAAEEPAEEVTEVPAEEVTEAAEEPAEEVTEAPAEEAAEAPAEEAQEPAQEVTEAPAEPVTEAPAEEVTEAVTEPAEAPTEAAAEAPAEEPEAAAEEGEEVANPVVGGLNAVTTAGGRSGKPEGAEVLRVAQPTETDSDDGLLISLADDEDVTNGLITVTYDTEVLNFVEVTNPTEAGADVDDLFYSAHNDEEAGTVTFVFAVRSAVEAGEEIAELKFTKACEDNEILVATSERNQDLDLEEEESVEVEGTGHDWKLDSVEWEGDDDDGYTKATFTFVCQNNEDHVEVV